MSIKKYLCAALLSASLITVGTSTEAHVLDGAQQFKGHYYKNFENPMPWEDAEAFCKSMGGHLATAEDREEMIPIKKAIESGGKSDYWIGGYITQRGIWKWVTGGTITDQNWHSGQPDNYLEHKPRMYVYRGHNGEWSDARASDKYAFVCEWDSADQAHDSDW
ncbi:MAG: C-type lectin domain-containing protein [Selenomonadaceae bacterium]|nr:C-type lectin domain-containing protein [Selenomonadaceae bacterium]